MEIRDPIHGPIQISEKEKEILDHPLVQRLRRIKQLGFAELTFPGATHSRYIHSIGAMHLAGTVFDSIFRDRSALAGEKKFSKFRQVVRLAALLHDLGHPPLSHALDSAFSMAPSSGISSHEDLAVRLISKSGLATLIEKLFGEEGIAPDDVSGLISGNATEMFEEEGLNFFPILRQIISSEMDCDRMDYLLRDSFFTGVSYGNIDLKWLISNLMWHEADRSIYLSLDSRAIFTFEDFLLSRYHMFLMIYFHNKTVIYQRILLRFVETSSLSIPLEPEEFVNCDDNWLYSRLANSKNIYAAMLLNQTLPKLLLEFWGEEDFDFDWALDALAAAGIYYEWIDSDIEFSKYYKKQSEKAFPIFVFNSFSLSGMEYVPLEKYSDLFLKYEKGKRIRRLYCRPEEAERAKSLLKIR